MPQKNYELASLHLLDWAANNGEIVEVLNALDQEGIRAALYSGTVAEIGMKHLPAITGFTRHDGEEVAFEYLRRHIPVDIDLLVHHDDFWKSVDVLQLDVKHENRSVDTTDNRHLNYKLLVARRKISHKTLEICHPNGPMSVQNGEAITEYNWHISDLAAEEFHRFETGYGSISISPPETEIIYGILQRSNKDIAKAALASMAINSQNKNNNYNEHYSDYIAKRLEEMNIDKERMVEFSQKVMLETYRIRLEREFKSLLGHDIAFQHDNDGTIKKIPFGEVRVRIDASQNRVWLENLEGETIAG